MAKKILLLLIFTVLSLHSLELPTKGKFQIKNIKDLNIIFVSHNKNKGHISNSLIELVQYYLLEDNTGFSVIFPQFSVESKIIKGTNIAIKYKGVAKETGTVKKAIIKGGQFASYIYKGNYKYIEKGIRKTFQKILETKQYIPDVKEEIRLLYWNSIDDNHPKNLITEIQVRIQKKF